MDTDLLAGIAPGWRAALAGEAGEPYLAELARFLGAERAGPVAVHPPAGQVLEALRLTDLPEVAVVILGQDPYHGAGQAMGLAFSVPVGVPAPPSLRNIQAEIAADLGCPPADRGDLRAWAAQGVLLLNTTLTVREGQAGSHQGRGWEQLTAAVIDLVDRTRPGTVFMLWGRHAQRAGAGLDRKRHLVLEAAHPSPLSVRRGFAGCRHFSKANRHLADSGRRPVDWCLRAR